MRIAEFEKTGMVYRDATPEEVAEFERQQAEIPEPEGDTTEVRMTEIEKAIMELAELIGGGV